MTRADLLVHFDRLVAVLQDPHRVKLCLIDVKSNNIFIVSDVFAFADYGGAGETNTSIDEYTEGFIPQELLDGGLRRPVVDRFA